MFYSNFIDKLIRAGRGDGIKPYFLLDEELGPAEFIRFANKFIEEYYATVPPEFAITHRMKFGLGTISKDDLLVLNRDLSSREIVNHPGINGGILYVETKNGEMERERTLDASIFRQACFIRRERRKFQMAVLGSVVAVIALALSMAFRM